MVPAHKIKDTASVIQSNLKEIRVDVAEYFK